MLPKFLPSKSGPDEMIQTVESALKGAIERLFYYAYVVVCSHERSGTVLVVNNSALFSFGRCAAKLVRYRS